MECIEPDSFSPDRLLAFADGDPDELLAAHLATCAACASAVAAYTAAGHTLHVHLYRADCPPTQDLGELVLDLLAPLRATTVRAHLAACPHCQAEFATLQTALAPDPLADLSPRPSPLRRLVARLLAPPGEVLAYSMVRGEASDSVFTYEAEDSTVSLTLEREQRGGAHRWTLLGLALEEEEHAGPPTGTARLFLEGQLIGEVPLDDLGNLVFPDLAAGLYSLELRLPDRLIAIPDVPVGLARS